MLNYIMETKLNNESNQSKFLKAKVVVGNCSGFESKSKLHVSNKCRSPNWQTGLLILLFPFSTFSIHTGMCIHLFAKWRCSAHIKLSQLIWQQKIILLNKCSKVSIFSAMNFYLCASAYWLYIMILIQNKTKWNLYQRALFGHLDQIF